MILGALRTQGGAIRPGSIRGKIRRMRARSVAVVVAMLAALVGAAAVARAGTPQLKVYFPADFTDRDYQQKAYTKVATAWKRPPRPPEEGHKAVVIVTIEKDGRALEPRLHLRSGSEPWDSAAVAAVAAAIPFGPLPKTYKGPRAEVHFHFEYDK